MVELKVDTNVKEAEARIFAFPEMGHTAATFDAMAPMLPENLEVGVRGWVCACVCVWVPCLHPMLPVPSSTSHPHPHPLTHQMMSVRMPGRGMREFEEPVKSMEALVDAIAGQVAPYMLSPCVMMGVGMGGVVAYYLIKELKRRDLPIPMRLFLLGRPTLLPSLQKDAPVDAQAARALVDKWGLQPESDVDKELWLSHVTADLQLLQSSDPALGVTRWPRESLVTLIHLDGAWAGSPESQATLEAWKRLFGPDADCIKCEYLEGAVCRVRP
eukprot:jgi/Mesvir1/1274/Mv16250-RA.1